MNTAQISYVAKVARDCEQDIAGNHARTVQPLLDVVHRQTAMLAERARRFINLLPEDVDVLTHREYYDCVVGMDHAIENLNKACADHDNFVNAATYNATQSIVAVVNGDYGVSHP